MTTAATSLLGLALPVTGELSGTWGDTVNNSITALLDSAVAGTTTLSADADVTLTTTTLAANQAREAIILWTAGGTVTRNITAPAQSKTYVVLNKTSSTQSIVIRGAGPTTGVTVLAGKQAMVAWDGTDFVEVSSGYVDGPASSTDNAVARFDGTDGKTIQNSVVIIADTTGNMSGVGTLGVGAITTSGALVGAVSQDAFNTVSTTLNLGGAATTVNIGAATGTLTVANATLAAKAVTATAVTNSALTATRLVYSGTAGLEVDSANLTFNGTILTSTGFAGPLNGTVGATTPAAGAFTTLSTTGAVTITGGTANGVAYLDGSKVLTTGSALTFDGTNLGVGAAAPVAKLTVLGAGTINAPETTTTGGSIQTASYGITTRTGNLELGATNALAANIGGSLTFSARYTSTNATWVTGKIGGYRDTAIDSVASSYLAFATSTGAGDLTEQARLNSSGLEVKQSQLIGYSSYAGIGTNGLAVAGSVGIGTASPSSKLSIAAATTAANADIELGNSVGVKNYVFTGGSTNATTRWQNNLVLYTGGAQSILFETNGANRMNLDSAGNLGLGVTPSAWGSTYKAFQVGNGGSIFGRTNVARQVGLSANIYNNGSGNLYIASEAASQYQQDAGAHYWYRSTSAQVAGTDPVFDQAMTLDASGQLGVGNTTMGQRLAVNGGIQTNGSAALGTGFGGGAVLSFESPVARMYFGDGTGYSFAFSKRASSATTDLMLLNDSGNLGLGVTPSAWDSIIRVLELNNGVSFGAQTDSEPVLYLGVNNYYGAGADRYKVSSKAATRYRSNAGAHFWFNAPSGTAGNAITFTQAMTLDASGNLLVGLTSSNARLHVLSTSASTTNAYIESNAANYTGSGIYSVLTGSGNNNTTAALFTGYNITSGDVFRVYGNGNVVNTNNSYGAISDVKLKENISDTTPKLADLMQVKVRNYNLIGGTTKQIGVVAQELENVFPAMVDKSPDKDAEGNDLGTTTKSVKYSVFVPMLIKAMQEQQAIIESLKARLDAANL